MFNFLKYLAMLPVWILQIFWDLVLTIWHLLWALKYRFSYKHKIDVWAEKNKPRVVQPMPGPSDPRFWTDTEIKEMHKWFNETYGVGDD